MVILFFCLPAAAKAADGVDINRLLASASVNGAAGFINNPSAYFPGHMKLCLAIHRFSFKANIGLFDMAEAGLLLDFGSSSDVVEILKGLKIGAKAGILREEVSFISVSAGIQNFPVYVFDGIEDTGFAAYIAASKKAGNANITAGIKKDLSAGDYNFVVLRFIGDISLLIYDTVLAIVEYDGNDFNAGVRVSMNYNLNAEIFVVGINRFGGAAEMGVFLRDHFVFGISYVQ